MLKARHLIFRWPFAPVAVLACAAIACFLAGSNEWGDRRALLSVYSAEAAEQATFTYELYAIGAINLLAAIALLLRPSGLGWWLALGTELGLFVGALAEGLLTDLGWFFFSILPLMTLLLLLAFRKAQDWRKVPLLRNLTAS